MQARVTTAAELLAMPDDGWCYELVRGELRRMTKPGFEHGLVAARLGAALLEFATRHELGVVVAAETGFLLERDPDTVRAPDAAFVARARVPAAAVAGYFPGAPDLAVEVVSPSDRFTAVEDKARFWLAHGCRLVWLVNPGSRHVTALDAEGGIRLLGPDDCLEAPELLPGFRLSVAELFGG